MSTPQRNPRPTNNFNCFKGKEGDFWMWKAMGRQPKRPQSGKFGETIKLEKDIDTFAIANGGIASPRQRTLRASRQFFRAIASKYHKESGFTPQGGWWLDANGFEKVLRTADGSGRTFQDCLKQLLCIPDTWGDCGYVFSAILTKDMMAWTGAGSPAGGSISPAILLDKRHRDKIAEDEQFVLGRPDLKIQQIYIPGDREMISGAFRLTSPLVRTGETDKSPFWSLLDKARLAEEAVF